eukprot:tig00021178_g19194.t1
MTAYLPLSYKTTENAAYIVFTSDSVVNYAGFTARVRSVPKPTPTPSPTPPPLCPTYAPCTIATAASGDWISFDDGSGSSNYALNLDYKWLITAPAGYLVQIEFTAFSVEYQYDWVRIHDGIDTNAAVLAHLSGYALPATTSYTTSGKAAYIRFVSDYTGTSTGFSPHIDGQPDAEPVAFAQPIALTCSQPLTDAHANSKPVANAQPQSHCDPSTYINPTYNAVDVGKPGAGILCLCHSEPEPCFIRDAQPQPVAIGVTDPVTNAQPNPFLHSFAATQSDSIRHIFANAFPNGDAKRQRIAVANGCSSLPIFQPLHDQHSGCWEFECVRRICVD